MKFRVTRANMEGQKKPCEEAEPAEATYLHYKTVSSLQKAKQYPWFNKWYNSTTNHREEKGMIVGESKIKHKIWVIEINSLDDILDLHKKYCGEEGCLSIVKGDYKEYSFGIEIDNDDVK